MNARTLIRQVVPTAGRRRLRQLHRGMVLRRALRRVADDPASAARSPDLLAELVYGWGNEAYSALPEYLSAILAAALGTSGAILECGSGLSTLLLAAAGRRSGARVWSLEHTPAWATRVRDALRGIDGSAVATVVDAPLRAYGEAFHWYDVSGLPDRRYAVVVCDGPPGNTLGGRYGLLPVMRDRLVRGATILADDAARPDEDRIVRRWAAESGGTVTVRGTQKPFAVLQLPD